MVGCRLTHMHAHRDEGATQAAQAMHGLRNNIILIPRGSNRLVRVLPSNCTTKINYVTPTVFSMCTDFVNTHCLTIIFVLSPSPT